MRLRSYSRSSSPLGGEVSNARRSGTGVGVDAVGVILCRSLSPSPFTYKKELGGRGNRGVRRTFGRFLLNYVLRSIKILTRECGVSQSFRNQLAQATLRAEPAVLKVLADALRWIVLKDFVKDYSWPELVPNLRTAIQSSNLIIQGMTFEWSTVNALTVLQTVLRQFQYFLNPKVQNEPVPVQLEIIAKDILVPLQATFHGFVDKVLSSQNSCHDQLRKDVVVVSFLLNFSMRSYMPSELGPILPSFCLDLFRILDMLSLDSASEDGSLLLLKIAKRSLIFFSGLIPSIVDSSFKVAKQSAYVSNFGYLSERIISLAFDVVSHVLETGPGWRFVSPHFSSLLDSAVFPALALNQKDIVEWEEDTEEYIRKNLPSDIDEISGWSEDLFTARKSAINLLGTIAMSKGPHLVASNSKRKKGDKSKGKQQESSTGELLVIPFLSKFPMPCHGDKASSKIVQNYYGVLMAYGGLQAFLKERNSEYTSSLVRNRVLPLYSSCPFVPYLVATANWLLGQLSPCLPEAMSSDVYDSLIKALTFPEINCINCYPVRASAARAIVVLLENEYVPPDWLSFLQVVVNRITNGDENELSFLFHLLGSAVEAGRSVISHQVPMLLSSVVGAIAKHFPSIPDPWPQVVERGFAALSAIIKSWEALLVDQDPEHNDAEWQSDQASIAKSFSSLLQQAWQMPMESNVTTEESTSLPPSCLDDISTLLGLILNSAINENEIEELKVPELLAVWAELIADWHAWEETEDIAVFDCIHKIVNLHNRCDSTNFFTRRIASRLSPGLEHSIIADISSFIAKGLMAYPSATRRAASCVHAILNTSQFSLQIEDVKQSITTSFTQAAFSHYKDLQNKPTALWKPLLLVIASCYIRYPEIVERVLDEVHGFIIFAHGLAQISSNTFKSGLSSVSEIKLAVISLGKLVVQFLAFPSEHSNHILPECFASLMEAYIHLKEVEEAEAQESDSEDIDVESEEETSYDEDSEDDGDLEETHEEFLERYAKAADELSEVAEGDMEDGQNNMLGFLEKIDLREEILLLLRRHHQVLLKSQAVSPNLVQQIMSLFPECTSLQVH
ncbi:hypothetical protein ZIOFF_056104 [Zingiber officinale]|uniref:ARM repeat superfamily protein n=1 Tax=Zingiber officinale TaxID=94328 RepID=A0A8J5KF60_ZINOF|nr:hypothetical protein ZIOFF_056104 [Zingiber officinale]